MRASSTPVLLGIALASTSLIAGCNGRGPHFSSTAFAAHMPLIQFSGSCLIQNSARAPLICQDFWNRPDSALEAAERTQCRVSGATWSADPCSDTDRHGGCRSKTDEADAYVIQWTYLADLAPEAKEVCPRDGSSEWRE